MPHTFHKNKTKANKKSTVADYANIDAAAVEKNWQKDYQKVADFSWGNLPWFALAALAVVLDQYTKYLASSHLTYAEPVPVLPFLNWTLLHNYGAAFSFLSNAGGWQRWFFTGLAVLVSLVLVGWLFRIGKQLKILAAAVTLILGGAIGNVIDRINLGYVVDFIHVFYGTWHFPAFNIADSAITLGVIFMLYDTFFLEPKREKMLNANAKPTS